MQNVIIWLSTLVSSSCFLLAPHLRYFHQLGQRERCQEAVMHSAAFSAESGASLQLSHIFKYMFSACEPLFSIIVFLKEVGEKDTFEKPFLYLSLSIQKIPFINNYFLLYYFKGHINIETKDLLPVTMCRVMFIKKISLCS